MTQHVIKPGLSLAGVSVGELHEVEFSVAPGEVVCLSGASGSGKSRLLRAIADLEPHSGEVRMDGAAQFEVPAPQWRRQVMLVPAESQWWFDSVGEHFPLWDGHAAEALGLDPAARGWAVSRLSSGEKQRLALLRALLRQPVCLLLDEPTANLDADSVHRVEQYLLEFIARHRCPTLWVAHDAAQIERVSDRHLHITQGRVQA